MKKIIALTLVAALLLGTLCGCSEVLDSLESYLSDLNEVIDTIDTTADPADETEPEGSAEFDEFIEELFLTLYLEEDCLSWAQCIADPEAAFGRDFPDASTASWYAYEAYTDEELEEELQENRDWLARLAEYDYDALSATQQSAYQSAYYALSDGLALYDAEHPEYALLSGSYISQYGGYVADFMDALSYFTYASEWSVEVLCYTLESTLTVFPSYADYAADRVAAGLPIKDATLSEMQDFLQNILDQGEDFYMYTYLPEQLEALDFLTSVQKETYSARITAALDECFFPAVEALNEALDEFYGYNTEQDLSYLAQAGSTGKELYEILAMDAIQTENLDLDAVYDALLDYADELEEQIYALLLYEVYALSESDYNTFYNYVSGYESCFGFASAEDALEAIIDVSPSIVSPLDSAPEVAVRLTDETVAAYANYLAAYSSSFMDTLESLEYIIVNPLSTDVADLESISTIAHEGYPGHMYSFVHAKEAGLPWLSLYPTCLLLCEGWAQYAGFHTLIELGEQSGDEVIRLACKYIALENMSSYILTGIYDLQVNYYGYSAQEFGEENFSYLSSYGYSDDDILEIARSYIAFLEEMSAGYLPYSYGLMLQESAHEAAQEALGDAYSETDFNDYILRAGYGPTLDIFQDFVNAYISEHSAADAA
ncbi:MAG: DUF885 domain-containing protein [Firmicutes bacterium]|nr:DUF885 domain-containing protein [Bacillota bacterium]